ncbi:hypothetical protein HN958_03300 [Candidatus Falkowbacteria bacterium]|jgi:hypothetical protein|nr:hypothetical protein [Candidatus Falkowbacteria bacterium]MBT7007503.1 hypothetical protein [Candidatus Falkowbacteria bacterium]
MIVRAKRQKRIRGGKHYYEFLGIFVSCVAVLYVAKVGILLSLLLGGCFAILLFIFIYPIPIKIPEENDEEDEDGTQ